jgi:DNA-binding NtrC family response regulator
MGKNGAILIVDDEAIILMSLRQELRSQYGARFRLESALNAAEANAIIDELAADGVEVILVISDWLMPGVKGDEFLADVKRRYPGIRCIIVSGHIDAEAIEAVRASLALDAFIQKPWKRGELLAAVDACVASTS